MSIERGGLRQTVVAYLHEQSSHVRGGLLRAPRRLLGAAPGPCKHYPGAARLALPLPRGRAGVSLHEALERAAGLPSEQAAASSARSIVDRSATESEMSLEQLTQLVFCASGVTSHQAAASGILLRAAPSAGALYPTDLYVAVRRVADVAPGLYYYHPHEHALVQVGEADRLEQIAASVARPERVRVAPVTFVLGATFDRTVCRYGSRAYRYVVLDTGHVAANLRLAAAALGYDSEFEPLFDDATLPRAVGLATDGEAALLVLPCAPATAVQSAASERSAALVPAHSLIGLPEDPDSPELTRLSHRLTSWRLVNGPGRTVLSPGGSTGSMAGPVGLTPPAAAQLDLFEAIRQRRSYRGVAWRPVEQPSLSGLLHDATSLARPVHGFTLLRLYVLVRAVAKVAPGIYRYSPEDHVLCPIGVGDRAREIQSAGLSQQVLGRAAFVMVWATATDRVEQLDCARGYRHALLDAGVAGEHVYLSAVARGLGVCGVGAFYDDAVNALIWSEQPGDAALYLLGVGHRDE